MSRLAQSPKGRQTLIVTVAALVLTLLAPSIGRAETTFTITGHGYGHGIGMSQYGAKSLAERGWSYADILGHYYQGTSIGSLGYTRGSVSETVMRVAIQKTDLPDEWWSVRANVGELWIAWEGMPPGGYLKIPGGISYTFFVSGDQIVGRDVNLENQKTFTGASWVQVWERDPAKPRSAGVVQILDPSGPFDWYNVLYNGSIFFQRSESDPTKLHARNHVYMEDYVRCVVPRESPALWPLESLKAQSVAARSYAYVSRKPANDYDVYCTTASQVYNGWGVWTTNAGNTRHANDSGVDPAVDATSAQVVMSGDTIVQTFFFSTSGGYTEDISNVWRASLQKPYYTAVPDPFEHESGSPKHDWDPFTYTASEVRQNLLNEGVSSNKLPNPIIDMHVTKRGASGRVMELQLIGQDGVTSTLSGSTEMGHVRNALCKGWDTWFYVDAITDRVEGATRYDTAVEISRASFSSSANVVVANGTSFADALTAAGLAGALDAPVLLVERTRVPDTVLAEIKRLKATKVYVIGGSGVVSEGAIADLAAIPAVGDQGIVPVAGADRYETGLRVAERIKAIKGTSYSGTAIVVSGVSFPDAVAAAPWAYRADTAIILVKPTEAPQASIEAVKELGATSVQVVGGQGAVSDAAVDDFKVTVKRVADGADRYATAALLADYLVRAGGFSWQAVHIASGESLVDAVTGGSYAARNSGPLLFATRYTLPEASADRLSANKTIIQRVTMFGGRGALNNVVEARIEESRE